MILHWLTQDLADCLAHDPRARVALWFDPEAEFERLLQPLAEHLDRQGMALLTLAPSAGHGALWLKWAAEMGPAASSHAVMWLPYRPEDLLEEQADGLRLDCLAEYRYTGVRWESENRPVTLPAFLKRHGVPLPAGRAELDTVTRGGRDSLLAKYVHAFMDRGEAFWRSRTLSSATIEESIVGDVQERLLRLLADPAREWEALQQAGISAEFQSQVSSRCADAADLASEPEAWSFRFVQSLIALDLFRATSSPPDFPLAAWLPPPSRHEALVAFLSHWQRDLNHLESYQEWAQRVDQTVDLRSWARTQTGRPQALLSLAADRWSHFLRGLEEVSSSQTQLRNYLLEWRQAALEETGGFWATTSERLPGWRLALDLVQLITGVEQALESLPKTHSAADIVEAYAHGWHKLDLAHWKLLSASRQADEMELLATVADRFYTRYLDAVNEAFYTAFRDGQVWPPACCTPVPTLLPVLYASGGPARAVLCVDALRFDLAEALRQHLDGSILSAVVANVPSETWVGMSSLLPSTDMCLEIRDGKPMLHPQAAEADLAQRAERWKLLEAAGAQCLGRDKKGARQDELRHLHSMATKPCSLPRLLVLFERGIDALGHGTKQELVAHFEQLLLDLERAVRKLQRWGYREIHVVTDHGFVILNASADIQPFEVDREPFACLASRWGLLQGPSQPPCAVVPFSLDSRWRVALSPGLRGFSATGAFFHGGATLQEVVIPHLRVVSAAPPRKMRVTASLPQPDVVTLPVRIDLVPDTPPAQDLFDTVVTSLEVQVFLGTAAEPRSSQKTVTIEPGAIETVSVTVTLQREPPISAGTQIPVQVVDVDTGENLAAGLSVRVARDLD